jgi:hypothetical protein
VKLLNSLLEDLRETFDFTDKKVAFITGSKGQKVVSKSDYFQNSVLAWNVKEAQPQIFIVILSKAEKLK